jgi:pimeloyl-ACP methyl ester carboxylesterase
MLHRAIIIHPIRFIGFTRTGATGSVRTVPASPSSTARDPRRLPLSYLQPTGTTMTSDGVAVCYYDLGGDGPDLVLAHATGFCAAVFSAMAATLRDRFRCVALDLRSHGRSDRPPDTDFDWHGYANDVLTVIDHLKLDRPAGFGHSCGGAALLLAEQARPGTFSVLYCYEPIVYPADIPLAPSLENTPLSAGALRRRSSFASREEALANFSSKHPFDTFRPEVLEAYVENGFAQDADGKVSLCCRREDEAQMYAHGFSHDAFARLDTIRCPVTLACGSETETFDLDFLALLAERLERSTTLALPGLGHFGPFVDPDAVARSVLASLAGETDLGQAEPLGG